MWCDQRDVVELTVQCDIKADNELFLTPPSRGRDLRCLIIN